MKALMLRAQYMVWSLQKFPRVTARCLRMLVDEDLVPALIDDQVLDEILRAGSATDASQGQLLQMHGRIRDFSNRRAFANFATRDFCSVSESVNLTVNLKSVSDLLDVCLNG